MSIVRPDHKYVQIQCVLFQMNTMQELLDYLEAEVDAKGLDALMPGAFVANYARPRRFEVCFFVFILLNKFEPEDLYLRR